jgi:glycosyltransferase involved in cell wall biosynthesis
VVPCYNEAARLQTDAFVEFATSHPDVHFLFVDDGSKDETARVLTELAQKCPKNMRAFSLAQNSGKAEAVRQGVLSAIDEGADFVGYWDADLATPLNVIPAFISVLVESKAVLVFGARVRLLGRHVERQAARHYIGRVFATLAGVALRLPIYDTQCGAKLFRVSPELRKVFETPFELGWTFDVELFSRLVRLGRESGLFDPQQQFVEFPLEQWCDAPGSKLRPAHFPRIGLELAKLFIIARRR